MKDDEMIKAGEPKRLSLTKYEQETIINYNQEEKTASVYTCDMALIRRLDKLCQNYTEITVSKGGIQSKEYTFPKRWIKIRAPRQLSDEQRGKLAERASANLTGARRGVDND